MLCSAAWAQLCLDTSFATPEPKYQIMWQIAVPVSFHDFFFAPYLPEFYEEIFAVFILQIMLRDQIF